MSNKSQIILASGSHARQQMLSNAGIDFDIIPAAVDEERILTKMQNDGASSGNITLRLAKEKALEVSKKNPDKYIIGADQVLSMKDKIYNKAKSQKEARGRLLEFQGQDHFLTSAVCVMKEGKDLWHKIDAAALKMKSMDSQAIDKYIEIAGDEVISCVGCYALESVGVRLFEDIRGDFFTILGMPLLPLLGFLDREGLLS